MVSFDARASTDDEAITSLRWEVLGSEDIVVLAPSFDHQFEEAGQYTVRLTVMDRQGLRSVAAQAISVANTPPIASCRFSNDDPVRGESVRFDASASLDLEGRLVDFVREFGDGSTRRGTRVSHAYNEIGLYLVRLTVEDNLGASATIEHQTTIMQVPAAVVSAAPKAGSTVAASAHQTALLAPIYGSALIPTAAR